MKIKGIVEGVLRNADTLEVIRTFKVNNTIRQHYFLDTYKYDDYSRTGNFIYGYSDQGYVYVIALPDVSNVSRSYFVTPNMHVKTLRKRFPAPSSDRSIISIGVCSSFYNSIFPSEIDASVTLTEPVVQLTNEILDVSYKIQTIFEPNNPDIEVPENTIAFSRATNRQNISVGFSPEWFDAVSTIFAPTLNVKDLDYGVPTLFSTDDNLDDNPIYENIQKYYRTGKKVSIPATMNIGMGISHISPSSLFLLFDKIFKNNESPVQTIVGKSSTNRPFFSSGYGQLGLGKIDINGDNWTRPDWAKYLEISIKTSGLESVGSYKFRMNPFFGYVDNTFEPRKVPLQTTTVYNSRISNGFKIGRDDDNGDGNFAPEGLAFACEYKGANKEVMFLWIDEFAVIDVVTGNAVHGPFNNTTLFGSETTPSPQYSPCLTQSDVQVALPHGPSSHPSTQFHAGPHNHVSFGFCCIPSPQYVSFGSTSTQVFVQVALPHGPSSHCSCCHRPLSDCCSPSPQ